jgi:hypothetical protein
MQQASKTFSTSRKNPNPYEEGGEENACGIHTQVCEREKPVWNQQLINFDKQPKNQSNPTGPKQRGSIRIGFNVSPVNEKGQYPKGKKMENMIGKQDSQKTAALLNLAEFFSRDCCTD